MKFESSKFKAIKIGWSYVERSAVGRSADCRRWEGTFYYTPYELLIINPLFNEGIRIACQGITQVT